jgi:hypothetical protein
MEKEFIPYEQALALKELGFDEPCLTYYNYDKKIERSDDWAYGYTLEDKRDRNECLAPLYQQAFRWFREKHNLDSFVKHLYIQTVKVGYYFGIDEYKGKEYQSEHFKTYEEAELECLKKLIEIINERKGT